MPNIDPGTVDPGEKNGAAADAGGGATGGSGPAAGEPDEGGVLPPEAANWWQFASKDAAETWANNLVTTRLSRERKNKLDPITEERDKLKQELDELRPLRDATKTDAERWETEKSTLKSELDELRGFKAHAEHATLVRELAEELGLPAKFISRVRGDDEDAIRSDISDLLNVLSEGGLTPGKKTPAPKAPKGDGGEKKNLHAGGGGGDSESDDELSASILETIRNDRKKGGMRARR